MCSSEIIQLDENKPHEIKINKASRLLFNWNDCVAESEKEYLERIRKVNMLTVMKRIIKNELNDTQKAVLKLRHFENKSFEAIAAELFMSPSAVNRCLKKAEGIVAAYMKYVHLFADIGLKNSDKPLDVKMAVSQLLLENSSKDKIGLRLRKSRAERAITLEKAALCTGLTKERLNTIEETGNLVSGELKRLIAFYGVSADYILFGAE